MGQIAPEQVMADDVVSLGGRAAQPRSAKHRLNQPVLRRNLAVEQEGDGVGLIVAGVCRWSIGLREAKIGVMMAL